MSPNSDFSENVQKLSNPIYAISTKIGFILILFLIKFGWTDVRLLHGMFSYASK